MPRKRMIHPSFFTSATLARMDPRTMVLFAGLWIYCDDYGRGEDDAALIAAAVWPRRRDIGEKEVEDDLSILAEAGVIHRYVVGGDNFLHVTSWHEHQRVSHPTSSKVPPCPTCDTVTYREWWRGSDTATDRWRKAEKRLQHARTRSGETPE